MSQHPGPAATTSPPRREGSGEALAVFDLDGTLIKTDSFLPYLFTYARRGRRLWPIVVMPIYLALYACRFLSDRDAKERLIEVFFGNEPLEKISAHSQWFCSNWVQRRLRADTVTKLREHQAAGHRVVLVSASPDLFVPQIGRYLGINETICTQILFENGYCSGKFVGPNCKGDNKVILLTAYLGVETAPDQSYAYGDSRSDFPLLSWVRHGNLVRRNGIMPFGSPRN